MMSMLSLHSYAGLVLQALPPGSASLLAITYASHLTTEGSGQGLNLIHFLTTGM